MARHRNSPYTQDEIEEKINNGIRAENEYNFEKRRILREELDKLKQSVQDAEDAYNNATTPKKKKEALQELLAVQEELISKEREYRNLNTFNALVDDFGKFSKSVKDFYSSIRDFVNPWAKADEAASKFTKTLGGTKKAMDALRSRTIENVATGIGVKFNTSMEELIEAQTNYLKGIGRNVSIDDSSQESIAAISRISKDAQIDGLGLASQFENFGVSIEKTGDHLGEMFADASKSGISFQKYSENVTKNIRIAQNYTFKDGLKGLENMAKKATAIKMDMQQVANFAEKVNTVEGSIETSAKLQVLGGPFASLSNPMEMLNESLNDMEAFQDRQIKLFTQFGRFNKETGEVSISSFDKRRLRAYAEATGQDYSSVMESVQTGAKRAEISKQITASATASKFDKDMKELIMNTASFKDGKAGVSINGKFKNIDELTDADKETMQQMSQSESKDIKQIAMDLRSFVQKEEGIKKAFEGVKAWLGAFLGIATGYLMGIFNSTAASLTILGTIAAAQGIGSIGGSITNMFGKGGSIRRLGKLITGTSGGSAHRIGGSKFFSNLTNMFGKGGIFKRLGNLFTGTSGGSAHRIGGSKIVSGITNMFGKGGSVRRLGKFITDKSGGLVQRIGSSKIVNNLTNMFSKGGSVRRLGKLFTGTSGGSAHRIGGSKFFSNLTNMFGKGDIIKKLGKLFTNTSGGSANRIGGGKIVGGLTNMFGKGGRIRRLGKLITDKSVGLAHRVGGGKIVSGLTNMFGKGGSVRRLGKLITDTSGNLAHRIGGSKIVNNLTNKFGKGGSVRRLGKLITDTSGGLIHRVGGSFKKGLNFIGGGLKKGFRGTGGSVKNIFKGVTGGASNTIGNSSKLGSTLLKGGKGLLKGGGIAGAGLGIVGAIGNHYTDKAVAEGKMEVGGVGHKAAKAGSQALTGAGIGATIGSIIPGIGTAVGAAVGAAIGGGIGLYQASKAKNKKVLDEQLASKGIEVKGDYSNGKLKDIDKALQDGKLSDSLRRKLIANGDMAIVTEIEKKKEELDAKKEKKEEKIKQKIKIGVADISIGKANFNGIGINNSLSPKKNSDSVSIKGIKEKGHVSRFDKIKERTIEKNVEEKNIPKDFNINIKGTLKLEGNNGQNIDIIGEIRKNPQLLRQLTEMLAKEIIYLDKGTYVGQKNGK